MSLYSLLKVKTNVKAAQPPNPTKPAMDIHEDRISRLTRALQLFTPRDNTVAMFHNAEHALTAQIEQKENEIRNLMKTSSYVPGAAPSDIEALKAQRVELRKMRMQIMTMVYRTIRDVYNQDADEQSRIEA